jgi:hypothetical protein
VTRAFPENPERMLRELMDEREDVRGLEYGALDTPRLGRGPSPLDEWGG